MSAVSPTMFSSGEEEDTFERNETQETVGEVVLLEKLNTLLSGIPPPPSLATCRLSHREMLQRIKANENLLVLPSGPIHMTIPSNPKVYYSNNGAISEEIASLMMKVQSRFVQCETLSTCTAWFQSSLPLTDSAKKKRQVCQGPSPGRRLSHLARRRQVFSRANLQQLSKNDANNHRLAIKTKVPSQRLKNYIESRKVQQPALPKRALFQSPEDEAVRPGFRTVVRHLPRRKLFGSGDKMGQLQPPIGNGRYDVSGWIATQNFNGGVKRMREEKRERDGKRRCPRRSLDFSDSSPSLCSEASTQESASLPPLSTIHKQKLLWAVSFALKERNVTHKDALFKPCATVLFNLCRRNLAVIRNMSVPGGTSEKMLRFARQEAPAVVAREENKSAALKDVPDSILNSQRNDRKELSELSGKENALVLMTPKQAVKARAWKSCLKSQRKLRRRLRRARSCECFLSDSKEIENEVIKGAGPVNDCPHIELNHVVRKLYVEEKSVDNNLPDVRRIKVMEGVGKLKGYCPHVDTNDVRKLCTEEKSIVNHLPYGSRSNFERCNAMNSSQTLADAFSEKIEANICESTMNGMPDKSGESLTENCDRVRRLSENENSTLEETNNSNGPLDNIVLSSLVPGDVNSLNAGSVDLFNEVGCLVVNSIAKAQDKSSNDDNDVVIAASMEDDQLMLYPALKANKTLEVEDVDGLLSKETPAEGKDLFSFDNVTRSPVLPQFVAVKRKLSLSPAHSQDNVASVRYGDCSYELTSLADDGNYPGVCSDVVPDSSFDKSGSSTDNNSLNSSLFDNGMGPLDLSIGSKYMPSVEQANQFENCVLDLSLNSKCLFEVEACPEDKPTLSEENEVQFAKASEKAALEISIPLDDVSEKVPVSVGKQPQRIAIDSAFEGESDEEEICFREKESEDVTDDSLKGNEVPEVYNDLTAAKLVVNDFENQVIPMMTDAFQFVKPEEPNCLDSMCTSTPLQPSQKKLVIKTRPAWKVEPGPGLKVRVRLSKEWGIVGRVTPIGTPETSSENYSLDESAIDKTDESDSSSKHLSTSEVVEQNTSCDTSTESYCLVEIRDRMAIEKTLEDAPSKESAAASVSFGSKSSGLSTTNESSSTSDIGIGMGILNGMVECESHFESTLNGAINLSETKEIIRKEEMSLKNQESRIAFDGTAFGNDAEQFQTLHVLNTDIKEKRQRYKLRSCEKRENVGQLLQSRGSQLDISKKAEQSSDIVYEADICFGSGKDKKTASKQINERVQEDKQLRPEPNKFISHSLISGSSSEDDDLPLVLLSAKKKMKTNSTLCNLAMRSPENTSLSFCDDLTLNNFMDFSGSKSTEGNEGGVSNENESSKSNDYKVDEGNSDEAAVTKLENNNSSSEETEGCSIKEVSSNQLANFSNCGSVSATPHANETCQVFDKDFIKKNVPPAAAVKSETNASSEDSDDEGVSPNRLVSSSDWNCSGSAAPNMLHDSVTLGKNIDLKIEAKVFSEEETSDDSYSSDEDLPLSRLRSSPDSKSSSDRAADASDSGANTSKELNDDLMSKQEIHSSSEQAPIDSPIDERLPQNNLSDTAGADPECTRTDSHKSNSDFSSTEESTHDSDSSADDSLPLSNLLDSSGFKKPVSTTATNRSNNDFELSEGLLKDSLKNEADSSSTEESTDDSDSSVDENFSLNSSLDSSDSKKPVSNTATNHSKTFLLLNEEKLKDSLKDEAHSSSTEESTDDEIKPLADAGNGSENFLVSNEGLAAREETNESGEPTAENTFSFANDKLLKATGFNRSGHAAPIKLEDSEILSNKQSKIEVVSSSTDVSMDESGSFNESLPLSQLVYSSGSKRRPTATGKSENGRGLNEGSRAFRCTVANKRDNSKKFDKDLLKKKAGSSSSEASTCDSDSSVGENLPLNQLLDSTCNTISVNAHGNTQESSYILGQRVLATPSFSWNLSANGIVNDNENLPSVKFINGSDSSRSGSSLSNPSKCCGDSLKIENTSPSMQNENFPCNQLLNSCDSDGTKPNLCETSPDFGFSNRSILGDSLKRESSFGSDECYEDNVPLSIIAESASRDCCDKKGTSMDKMSTSSDEENVTLSELISSAKKYSSRPVEVADAETDTSSHSSAVAVNYTALDCEGRGKQFPAVTDEYSRHTLIDSSVTLNSPSSNDSSLKSSPKRGKNCSPIRGLQACVGLIGEITPSSSHGSIECVSLGSSEKRKLSLENYKARKKLVPLYTEPSKREEEFPENSEPKKIYNIKLKHPISCQSKKKSHKRRSSSEQRSFYDTDEETKERDGYYNFESNSNSTDPRATDRYRVHSKSKEHLKHGTSSWVVEHFQEGSGSMSESVDSDHTGHQEKAVKRVGGSDISWRHSVEGIEGQFEKVVEGCSIKESSEVHQDPKVLAFFRKKTADVIDNFSELQRLVEKEIEYVFSCSTSENARRLELSKLARVHRECFRLKRIIEKNPESLIFSALHANKNKDMKGGYKK